MELLYLTDLAGSCYKEQVFELLCEADHEFVPPLSARESTTQRKLCGESGQAQPQKYFDELQKQPILLALEEQKVLGFLSYRRDFEEIPHCAAYISTVIVGKEHRGKGITEQLYRKLFTLEKGLIATRTWSQNAAHIHILEKLGFSLLKTIADHRGKGIHTVYYGKDIQ